ARLGFGAQVVVVGVLAQSGGAAPDETRVLDLVAQSPGLKLVLAPPGPAPRLQAQDVVVLAALDDAERNAASIRDAIEAARPQDKNARGEADAGAASPQRAAPKPPRGAKADRPRREPRATPAKSAPRVAPPPKREKPAAAAAPPSQPRAAFDPDRARRTR